MNIIFIRDLILNLLFPRKIETFDLGILKIYLESNIKIKVFNTFPITYSVLPYRKKIIKSLIINIKYGARTDALELMLLVINNYFARDNLWKKIVGSECDNFCVYLLPVPITKRRLAYRGFNQTERICRYLEYLNLNSAVFMRVNSLLLEKNVDTAPQAEQNLERRRTNLKGAFSINVIQMDKILEEVEERVGLKENYFFIVDDVTTTGSTLRETALAIASAGIPKDKIFGLTLAY
ncbi:MAG: hypothetical protein Q7R78_02320 [bacterium]|nr:hypothetical protein [bacterium]